MKPEPNEYDEQALEFLTETQTKIQTEYQGHQLYFDEDKEARAVWKITLTTPRGNHSFTFGESLANSWEVRLDRYESDWKANKWTPVGQGSLKHGFKEGANYYSPGFFSRRFKACQVRPSKVPPRPYQILAGLYSPVYTFADWCADYGYDTDSIWARRTYFKCQELAAGLERIYTEVQLEKLMEIS